MSQAPLPAPGSSDPTAAEVAAEAESLARSEPERAELLVHEVLAGDLEPGPRAVALRALGIAHRSRGDHRSAGEMFSRSIEVATSAGLTGEAAFGRVLMSSLHATAGRHAEAVSELEAAIDDLDGERLVAAVVQLGSVKIAAGDFLGGLETFESIEHRISELEAQQRAIYFMNRGSALLSVHRPDAAVPMFEEVIRLRGGIDGGGQGLSGPLHHLARAYALSGATPKALACFREIDSHGLGADDVTGLVDRASVLLSAGLTEEAEVAAARARETAADGDEYWVPLAPLIHSEILERSGDFEGAATAALEAAAAFDAQSDSLHGDLARSIAARCESRLGMTDPGALADLAGRLSRQGAHFEAMRTSLHLARALGHDERARGYLGTVAGRETHGFEDGALRAEATARLALLDGDSAAMRSIVGEALDELADWRAALGSTELTARAARLAAPLADLAVADGIEREDPLAVLLAVERLRVSSVVSNRGAAAHPEIRGLLDRLRSVTADTRIGDDAQRLELEAEIRALARIGGTEADMRRRLAPDRLLDGFDDTTLVEFVDHDGWVTAVVVDGEPRMATVAQISEIRSEVDSIRFAMQRLSTPVGSAASRSAFRTVLDGAAGRLAELLFEPLALDDDRPLVVVPSDSVASVPWAALRSLERRAFSVAPSAQLRVEATATVSGPPLVVGVEDPPSAIGEAMEIARMVGSVALTGRAATVAAVLEAMNGAGVAHLACHGRFRADNPLMSSVGMADGPLTVYDIERLERAPAVIVMSACEVGRSSRTPGEGLMGMSGSLMAAGTATVVASSTVVSDQATRPVMAELHRAVMRGGSVAEALRDARLAAAGDPETKLAAASFVCLGV